MEKCMICVGVLEGRIVWGVDRQPRSLQRARANIMAALGQLGMLTAQTCPKGLVHEVEHVLQVSHAIILNILCLCPASIFSGSLSATVHRLGT